MATMRLSLMAKAIQPRDVRVNRVVTYSAAPKLQLAALLPRPVASNRTKHEVKGRFVNRLKLLRPNSRASARNRSSLFVGEVRKFRK
jgi:hypothetical protein